MKSEIDIRDHNSNVIETNTLRNRTLLKHHREHLYESGLTDETIEKAGIYSITDTAVSGKKLNWAGPGPARSIVFPYFDMKGEELFSVLRPDEPIKRENGSEPKYESPKDSDPFLYFPPNGLVPFDTWSNPEEPIIVVEGIKKALAAVQAGMPAISAQGVSVWHDTQQKKETGVWELHSDFNDVALKGRRVYVAFDGGDTENNIHVILAEARLASMLADADADVRLLRIPCSGSDKVGLDDFLVEQDDPRAAIQQLLSESLQGNILMRIRELETSADPKGDGLKLLKDRSFLAGLKIANQGVLDVCYSEIRRITGITKTAIEQKVRELDRLFTTNAPVEDENQEEVDFKIEEEAEALLKAPDLLQRLLVHFKSEGLIGEEAAATMVLLACVSRLSNRPLNVVVKAASSAGKNYMVSRVIRCFSPKEVHEISDISRRALLYIKGGLNRKIVVIAEQEGAMRSEYTIRTVMSEGRLTVWVTEKNESGKFETRKHTVDGQACFITTTTRAKLHDENETRLLEINLDESQEQTDRILQAQASNAAQPLTGKYAEALERSRKVVQTALSRINAYPVSIPQAKLIVRDFPVAHVRRRRDFLKLLGLVEACALLHQRQRITDDGMVIAADEDVHIAEDLFRSLLSDNSPLLNELSRRLSAEFNEVVFTPKEAATALGQDPDALRRRLRELEKAELVEIAEVNRGNKPAKWRVVFDSSSLPDNSQIRTEPIVIAKETPLSDCSDVTYTSDIQPQGLRVGEKLKPVSYKSACLRPVSKARTVEQEETSNNSNGFCPIDTNVGQSRAGVQNPRGGRGSQPSDEDHISDGENLGAFDEEIVTKVKTKSPHGTQEWADDEINIQVGCEHRCLYCCSCERINATQSEMTIDRWIEPDIKRKKVDKGYRKRVKADGTVKTLMLPSSHDITPLNINEVITVLKKLLKSGNRMLIVSKPHLSCIKTICEELAEYRKLMLFRFTIGSVDNRVLQFWERGAPSYEERINALKWAFDHGFETSVSCEPMLDGNVDEVIKDVRDFVTDSIWLGKANRLRNCVAQNCEGDLLVEARKKADELIAIQSDENIHKLYERYKDAELIKWKDSIKQVVGIKRPVERGLDV
ncbi:MAG: DUF3854 domain-containing protein [Proteobacteria bacterium]|nr:DUF3854 domain-containing protein [Pseudomonadota bacterium]